MRDMFPLSRKCEGCFDVTWDEEPRGHNWDFWDSQIKKVIDWLPLGTSDAALGSGKRA